MTVEALIDNEQFQEKLHEAKNIAEVKALFEREGVDITEDKLMKLMLPEGEDLTEEALENVSGGGSVLSWLLSKLGRGSGGGGGHAFGG